MIALFLVGWGEIVEFVRAEVITIRSKPFVESAIAIGQSTPRLIRVHFLPNLAPGLIAVAAVEVSAVLLILGELGFIDIFIQGGASSDFGLYSQVPEWGSLLAGVRTWVRSYPWTGLYPVMAFFIAILGFNLLGEGLRRLLGRFGIIANTLFSRYSLILLVLGILAYLWLRQNTGELVFYRQQADTFDGDSAITHIEALTDPAMDGRALGSDGLDQAAEYIRDQFAALGLQPAGERISYFQDESRAYHILDETPRLLLNDEGSEPEFRQEFMVYPKATLNMGQGEGNIRLLAWGAESSPAGLDFSEEIVILLTDEHLDDLGAMSCRGVLVVASDLGAMKQRYTMSTLPPGEGCGLDTPVLWISDRLGTRILQDTGWSVPRLLEHVDELGDEDRVDIPTAISGSIDIPGRIENDARVVNVIGHLPGTSDALDHELVFIVTQYDSSPLGPDGAYPGANSSASGVAVMLEAIRTMQESGYQPFRTFLFVAYSGEGLPDLASAPEVRRYLDARVGFDEAFDIQAVIYLRGLGAGGDRMSVWSPGKSGLAKLMESAAQLTGMRTERMSGNPDMNVFVPGGSEAAGEEEFPQVGVSRQGWQKTAHLPNDSLTFVTPGRLEETGRAISLGLMIIGRERSY